MKSDKIKIIIAIVIFVVAAAVIAYNMGLFGGGGGNANLPQAPTGEQPKGGPRSVN